MTSDILPALLHERRDSSRSGEWHRHPPSHGPCIHRRFHHHRKQKKGKFCYILNELKNNTQTKFLIITHNKITMSSIDRVYGVTMPQKGISDIVSVDFEKVDLQEAI